jgi:hypothetical protein
MIRRWRNQIEFTGPVFVLNLQYLYIYPPSQQSYWQVYRGAIGMACSSRNLIAPTPPPKSVTRNYWRFFFCGTLHWPWLYPKWSPWGVLRPGVSFHYCQCCCWTYTEDIFRFPSTTLLPPFLRWIRHLGIAYPSNNFAPLGNSYCVISRLRH